MMASGHPGSDPSKKRHKLASEVRSRKRRHQIYLLHRLRPEFPISDTRVRQTRHKAVDQSHADAALHQSAGERRQRNLDVDAPAYAGASEGAPLYEISVWSAISRGVMTSSAASA